MKLQFYGLVAPGFLGQRQREKAFALSAPDHMIRSFMPSTHEESRGVSVCKNVGDPDPSVTAEPALNCLVHNPPRFVQNFLPFGKSVVDEGYLLFVFLFEPRKSGINFVAVAFRCLRFSSHKR